MKMNIVKGKDFTSGKVFPQLVSFLIPFILSNLLNSLYNTVDTAVIGQYVGASGTVAVTMGGKTLNTLTLFGTSFASAGQILIAQQVGAKRHDELNETIGTMFTALIIMGAVLGALSILFCDPILMWLNTPVEALPASRDYLIITSAGLALMFGYNAVSAVLRSMGDSKSPLLFIAIATILNLVLDILFVRFMNMSAAGTALATVIGQGTSLVCSTVLLYRHREHFGFNFKLSSFAIKKDKLAIMTKLGVPLVANSMMISLTQLFMVRYVNAFGLVESAAYGIGDKVIHLLNVITTSVKAAAGAMVGQNVGAGKYDRVKQVVRYSLLLTGLSALFLSVFCLLCPHAMFRLFTSDPAVVEFGPSFMPSCVLIFILSAIMSAYGPVVTGTGNAKLSLIGGILDGVVFRIGFSFLFGMYLNMGVVGFFLGNALARLGPVSIDLVYYYSGAWKRYRKLVKEKPVSTEGSAGENVPANI